MIKKEKVKKRISHLSMRFLVQTQFLSWVFFAEFRMMYSFHAMTSYSIEVEIVIYKAMWLMNELLDKYDCLHMHVLKL